MKTVLRSTPTLRCMAFIIISFEVEGKGRAACPHTRLMSGVVVHFPTEVFRDATVPRVRARRKEVKFGVAAERRRLRVGSDGQRVGLGCKHLQYPGQG
jgi:hypothetical protein